MTLFEHRYVLMSSIKSFLRTVVGALPIALEKCFNKQSTVDYQLYGNCITNGTPSIDTPMTVEFVGDKTKNLISPDTIYEQGFINQNGIGITKDDDFPSIGVFTIPVKPNTTYSYRSGILNNITYTLLDENKSYLGIYGGLVSSAGNVTFTTTSETAYVQLCSSTKLFDEGCLYFNEGTHYVEEPYGLYKIPIIACGKNLFDYKYFYKHYVYPYETTEVGRVIYKLKPNTSYTISTNVPLTDDGYARVFVIAGSDISFAPNSAQNGVIDKKTVTTKDDGNLVLGIYSTGDREVSISDFENELVWLQIEKGLSASTPELYKEPITTNIYLNEPLRKVGDYADYIDFENQKVIKNIISTDLSVDIQNSPYRKQSNTIKVYKTTNCIASSPIICPILPRVQQWVYDAAHIMAHSSQTNHIYYAISWKRLGLTFDGTNAYKTDDETHTALSNSQIVSIIKAYLGSLPTEVRLAYLVASVPVKKNIELPKLPAFKGTTIYSVHAAVQPSKMQIKYYSTERGI